MLQRLILQFKRSALFHKLAIFLASGWAVLQIIDAFIDNGILPAWSFKAAVVMLLIGLPVVLATAFFQGMRSRDERTITGAGDDAQSNDVPSTSSATVSSRTGAAHRLFTWRNAALGGVAAFALLGMVAGGWMGMRVLGIGSPGTLLARGVIERGGSVVLADFESGADTDLADVVARTLRIDLMQSPMIRVIDRTELNAPLARMQIEPQARITTEIATQLAEREGYAAVITGDVAKAGSSYVVTADIRAGAGFLPAAAFRETARNDDGLVDAIERLSRAIRDKAGESLRTVQGGASLEQVTTSSLPALREYTRGESRVQIGDHPGGLEHFERAVALDSTFAMAHRRIAQTLSNMRVRRPDAVRAYRRAFELRDKLPELERRLAIGSYHDRVTGDIAAATSAFEQALAIDSLNNSARNSLANLYIRLGRSAEAVQHYGAGIRARPTAALFGNLAYARFRTADVAGAMATLDSGMAVLPAWVGGYYNKASLAIARLDISTADSATRILQQKAQTASDRVNSRFARYSLAALRGRLREAEAVLDEPAELGLADPVVRAAFRAQLRLLRGDTAAAIRLVQEALFANPKSEDPAFYEAVYALARARAGDAAHAALVAWRAASPDEELGLTNRLDRAYVTGMTQRAQRDFDRSLATLLNLQRVCPGCGALAPFGMAETYDQMGQATRAIEAYEQGLNSYDPFAINLILSTTLALRRLGELYDAQGNAAKAVEHYARFVELWRDADPELQPMVRQAETRLQALLPNRR